MKKIIAIILTVTIIFSYGFTTYAVADSASKPLLSSLSYKECLQFLEDNNIEISPQLSHLDIKQVIEKLETNPDYASGISWTISADFHDAVSKAIQEYYGTTFAMPISTFGLNYTLEHSTLYEWNKNIQKYNCYAYALGITSEKYNPGDFYGKSTDTNFDPKEPYYNVNYITLAELIPLVVADLQSNEMEIVTGNKYACIKTQINIRPTSLGNWNNIIALRTDEDGQRDFHFAKLFGSDWLHKPGTFAIMKFNNPPSLDEDWTNEGYNGINYIDDTITYESKIVYFLYKTDHIYNNTYTWTGEHYHAGDLHWYERVYTCACGDIGEPVWEAIPCSGPPCSLVTSIEETPVTE